MRVALRWSAQNCGNEVIEQSVMKPCWKKKRKTRVVYRSERSNLGSGCVFFILLFDLTDV